MTRVDAQEFEQIVRDYAPMVKSYAYHLLHNRNDVEDLAQDVFLKAYESIHQFRGGSIRAYLSRITRNRCYDVLRRQKVQGQEALEFNAEAVPASGDGPEETVINRSLVAQIHAILGQFQEVDREIVLLRHVYQFSYDEIASVLHMKQGAVRTRLSRVRQRIVQEVERGEQLESSDLG